MKATLWGKELRENLVTLFRRITYNENYTLLELPRNEEWQKEKWNGCNGKLALTDVILRNID